jgi:curved DNA-binding protein CbpA
VTYDPKADHYARLGVPHTATPAEIRTAYRARIRRAHPDMSTGSTATAAALNVAYEVLGHPAQRAAYDAARRRHQATVSAAKAARASTRPKKGRARAAAPAASKGGRKARGAARATSPVRRPAAPPSPSAPPPPPNAFEVVAENVVRNIQREQYGKAFAWFFVGLAASAVTPPPSPSYRQPPSPRRRR